MTDDDRYIKTDYEGYYLDKHTRAIINRNEHEYSKYKKSVGEFKERKALEDEVKQLKSDVSQIKELLHAIHGKLNDKNA
jgi:hypothetical protein